MTLNALDCELMTEVHRIEYDSLRKRGRVFMAAGCCVDMSGTIALFTRIDPDVCLIETIAGDVPDTSYRRSRDREWRALTTKPPTILCTA